MDKLNQAIELKRQMNELDEKKMRLNSQLNELKRDVMPKATYGNIKITQGEYNGRETIRISEFLLNEEEKKLHMSIFGSISGNWDERRGSVSYYRNEYGILEHEGGGWILLKDCIPCSDEEWESIKAGNIPDKFKNPKM